MDPGYSKAYGRMGLAHSSLNKHKEAVENFKKGNFWPIGSQYFFYSTNENTALALTDQ